MGASDGQMQWTIASRLRDLPPSDYALACLESAALNLRADLVAARLEIDRLAQSLGMVRFNPLASDVTVGANVEKETDGALSSGPSISLPVPLFNQGQSAIAAAQARLRQSQRHYQAMAVEVRSEVRHARNRMAADRILAERYASVILPARHQIVEQSQLQYNGMLLGIFQLLEARQGEIEAGRGYVESLRDYWIARAELKRAVGGQFPPGDGARARTTGARVQRSRLPAETSTNNIH